MVALDAEAVDNAFQRASKLAAKAVEKVRGQNPGATDEVLVEKLESLFFKTVTTSGAASGGVAAIPGVGTAAALVSGVGDATLFLTVSAAHVLAVANVYGVPVEDCERQRALLMTVLAGGELTGDAAAAGRSESARPTSSIRSMKKTVGSHLLRKYAMKRGMMMLGKTAPFGIGAAIGAGGNYLMARSVITSTRKAFAEQSA